MTLSSRFDHEVCALCFWEDIPSHHPSYQGKLHKHHIYTAKTLSKLEKSGPFSLLLARELVILDSMMASSPVSAEQISGQMQKVMSYAKEKWSKESSLFQKKQRAEIGINEYQMIIRSHVRSILI